MDNMIDPNTFTKDKLISELKKNHIDIPTNIKQLRKSQIVQLYEDNLGSRQLDNGTRLGAVVYSSDEDLDQSLEKYSNSTNFESKVSKRKKKSNSKTKKSPSKTTAKIEMDPEESVLNLTDEELLAQLRIFGAVVGPITDTTRSVHQRKLQQLMTLGPVSADNSIHMSGYSSDEVDAEEGNESQDSQVSDDDGASTTTSVTEKSSLIRQRIVESKSTTPIIGRTIHNERMTSTPISLPTSAHEQLRRAREEIRNEYSMKTNKDSQQNTSSSSDSGKKTSCSTICWVGGSILVLVILLFVIFQNLEPSHTNLINNE